MEKIRIGQNNIKRIEVNDNGDYIVINFNDRGMINKFFGLMRDFESKKDSFLEKAKNIDGLQDENERIGRYIDLDLEVHKWLAGQIDNIFGIDTCKKVFGEGVVPSMECYAEFFIQLKPFFAEYMKAHATKYNPNRTGSR